MTTIAADSNLENIEKSVNVYIQTEIETGMGLKVIYELAQREGAVPNHWIEVATASLSAITEAMRTAHNQTGNLSQYLISLNCFELDDARASGAATIYSLVNIANRVRGKFAPGTGIPILDYDEVGTPQVGLLQSNAFPSVTSVPQETRTGFTQRNVSATLLHVMQTSI